MGDSSGVLPLNDSPLCYIASVSYEKGRQCLKPFVFIYKKIMWPSALGGPLVGDLTEDESMCWILFSMFPFYCMLSALIKLVVARVYLFFLLPFGVFGLIVSHSLGVYSVVYWYRDMPFQLIGAKAKFMIEVIPMITLGALHHLLEFNFGYLALVLGCTTYFYAFAHFMRKTYDIGGVDVVLGIVIQVLAYMLNAELFVRALALSICFGLCFYRYMTYCAPEVPAHRKKELVRLPCCFEGVCRGLISCAFIVSTGL